MSPIYIFKASSMIGMRDHLGQWWKVVQDCVRCGQCCMDQGPTWKFAEDEIMGGCVFLEERENDLYRCSLMMYRPLGCGVTNPHTIPKYCSIIMEKIDSPDELVK